MLLVLFATAYLIYHKSSHLSSTFFLFLNLFELYFKFKSPEPLMSFLLYFSATKIILPRHFPNVNNKFLFFPLFLSGVHFRRFCAKYRMHRTMRSMHLSHASCTSFQHQIIIMKPDLPLTDSLSVCPPLSQRCLYRCVRTGSGSPAGYSLPGLHGSASFCPG